MIRQPAVAGLFYPNNPQELAQVIRDYLSNATPPATKGTLKGLMVPHAGYQYSAHTASFGYALLQSLDLSISWDIIILAPTHRVPLPQASIGLFDAYQTPLGHITVSQKAHKLKGDIPFVPQAHTVEHSLEVQLPFLQMILPRFELIPILIGAMEPDELAGLLSPLLDEHTLIIASSDLSHYLPLQEAQRNDATTISAIEHLNDIQLANQGDACGINGILTVVHLAQTYHWKPTLLQYETSAQATQDTSQVVGYASLAFTQ